MESKRQRARKQEVLSFIERIVFSGYDQGIWQSLIVHTLMLTALALICDHRNIINPVAIKIAFISDDSLNDIIQDQQIVEMPSVEDLAEDLGKSVEEKELLDLQDTAAVELNDIKLEDINNDQIINYRNQVSINNLLSINESDINTDDKNKTKNNDSTKVYTRGSGSRSAGNSRAGGEGRGLGNLEKRLALYGAQTGDIQVSISWNNYNDIDVWLEYKDSTSYSMINWMNRSFGSAFLDIDMNYKPQTNQAIENIYWQEGEAPFGLYTVYIQNYHRWEQSVDATVVDVRILIDGKITYKKCTIKTTDGLVKIFSYNRKPTKDLIATKNRRSALKNNYGPGTFTPFGYSPDNIIIPPIPTFQ